MAGSSGGHGFGSTTKRDYSKKKEKQMVHSNQREERMVHSNQRAEPIRATEWHKMERTKSPAEKADTERILRNAFEKEKKRKVTAK